MIKAFVKGINFIAGSTLQKQHVFMGSSLDYLQRQRSIDKNYFDYIRLSTLELVGNEINAKGIKGNVAELGVYKGKFARYINQYFPDRILYLFDTFEGFDNRDVVREKNEHFSSGDQDFSDTSVAAVLRLMPFPAKCRPVKGFFPESAMGIEDTFAFVSLDADLYEPIYSGLQFFYPRLIKGGYIFIHDFNNDLYKGSRKAVEQFCVEHNIGFVPLPDSGGSAIITK
jgi:O-methyltransferase